MRRERKEKKDKDTKNISTKFLVLKMFDRSSTDCS
jgi:hypothetical protein